MARKVKIVRYLNGTFNMCPYSVSGSQGLLQSYKTQILSHVCTFHNNFHPKENKWMKLNKSMLIPPTIHLVSRTLPLCLLVFFLLDGLLPLLWWFLLFSPNLIMMECSRELTVFGPLLFLMYTLDLSNFIQFPVLNFAVIRLQIFKVRRLEIEILVIKLKIFFLTSSTALLRTNLYMHLLIQHF